MQPLIVIVGTTASGKSQLALQLAERFNGEIIAADSRTVYKGMDIGTAKPSMAEQARIPHHVLDIVTPDQAFTAADFQRQANEAIRSIQQRNKVAIMVGGTGLYVDSILYGFTFRPVDAKRRAKLEDLSVAELQQIIQEQELELPVDRQNPRHLIRTIESGGQLGQRQPLRVNTLVVGLQIPMEVLKQHISERVARMFAQGLEREVRNLAKTYSWQSPGLSAIGYREFKLYFEGQQSLEQTQQQITTHTVQYARRQRLWFKRSPDIQWCDTAQTAQAVVEAFLTTKDGP